MERSNWAGMLNFSNSVFSTTSEFFTSPHSYYEIVYRYSRLRRDVLLELCEKHDPNRRRLLSELDRLLRLYYFERCAYLPRSKPVCHCRNGLGRRQIALYRCRHRMDLGRYSLSYSQR